ncbi:MAG: hypothetical protein QOD74_2433 [Variibacter sp.]|nr:hypothetical protein [Variibacter sp.]
MTDWVFSTAWGSWRRALSSSHLQLRALWERVRAVFPVRQHPQSCEILRQHPRFRSALLIGGGVAAVAIAGCGVLAWRLASGPVMLDLITPWLTAALEERLGSQHKVQVGGTQLERGDDGRTAVRLRDIVVRDQHSVVVASAPKAEVGIHGSSLLMGKIRVERLSLIGAEMAMRIEPDGQLSVFAGGSALISDAPAAASTTRREAAPTSLGAPLAEVPGKAGEVNLLGAAMTWLQRLDEVGFDGRDLIEIGLKSGSIAIDDRRTGRHIGFDNIDLSLTRLKEGGAALALSSTGSDGPWSLNATVSPRPNGARAIEAVLRDLSPKDVLLALRLDHPDFQADVPVSAVFRAEVAADGTPTSVDGRVIVGAGNIGNPRDAARRMLIDEAQAEVRWDNTARAFIVPFEVQSGPNHTAVVATFQAPREEGAPWPFVVTRGVVTLASAERRREPPLVLDRLNIRGTLDFKRRRIDVAQAEVGGAFGVIASSGSFDFAFGDPKLMVGIAGDRLGLSTLKRMWPFFITPDLRAWVSDHVLSGGLDRMVLATNSPLSYLQPKGPLLNDDQMSLDVTGRNVAVRVLAGLPVVRDVEVNVRIVGQKSTITFNRGIIDLPSGRKLAVNSGTFESAKMRQGEDPFARVKLRVEGSADGVAELLASDALKDAAGVSLDPSATKGNLVAHVTLAFHVKPRVKQEDIAYAVDADITNFAADRLIKGLKAEAALLRVSATQDLMVAKGDIKIAGTPAMFELRKQRDQSEADVRLAMVVDEAARNRLGLELGPSVGGPISVKASGRFNLTEREGRMAVEADLAQSRIADLIPGWVKPPGKAARASFSFTNKGQGVRLEDVTLEGGGVSVKGGAIELDGNGDVTQASFPTFAVSDGDRASAKVERGSDGTLKVSIRGDLYDARGLLKTAMAGKKPEQRAPKSMDFDLDVKLGAITGHHGEALRNLELRLGRRGGQIRTFSLSGKLGQDAQIAGDLRTRGGSRSVMYVESNDAGALLRLADVYPKAHGGAISIAMDPPTSDNAPQDGLMNVRDFVVRGEAALDRVAVTEITGDGSDRTYRANSGGIAFSRMRVEFTRSPGKFSIHEGVVWGSSIGATVEGTLDYFRDEVRLRGTFVPAYGINNMFNRLPIVGMFLGGSNEGILGITYQVVGPTQSPVLQVNPMSAVAPGFLRKLFEFRGQETERASRAPEATR